MSCRCIFTTRKQFSTIKTRLFFTWDLFCHLLLRLHLMEPNCCVKNWSKVAECLLKLNIQDNTSMTVFFYWNFVALQLKARWRHHLQWFLSRHPGDRSQARRSRRRQRRQRRQPPSTVPELRPEAGNRRNESKAAKRPEVRVSRTRRRPRTSVSPGRPRSWPRWLTSEPPTLLRVWPSRSGMRTSNFGGPSPISTWTTTWLTQAENNELKKL